MITLSWLRLAKESRGVIRRLVYDLESHVSGRPLDRPHSRLNRSGIQIRQLGAGDLFNLLASDPAYLVAVGPRRPLVDPGSLLEKIGGGRRFGYERKRAISIDRYHHRDSHIHDIRGLGVKRLAELHDVYAVLTKRRTNWRCRIRFPGRDLKLDVRSYLFCHTWVLYEPASNSDAEALPLMRFLVSGSWFRVRDLRLRGPGTLKP